MDMMQKNIKVSVITAVYDSEAYLPAMLDSVCAQSLKEIEIICVDDGSADRSLSILKEYAKKDHRIVVLQQKEKTDGAAAARNLGIEHANGQYLSILDSDDFFEPDLLEKVYKRAIDTDADIVIYDGYEFDERIHTDKEAGYILRREYLPDTAEIFAPSENANRLFQMTLGAAWNCLFRRTYIAEHGIRFHSFHHADDLGFVYTAFACAGRIAIQKERLIHYRHHYTESQAANVSKWPETAYQALIQLKEELKERGVFEEFKTTFVQAVMIYILFYLDEMKDFVAFEDLYNALKHQYLEDLNVYEVPKEKFSNEYWVIVRDFIKERNSAEYLFYKSRGLPPFSGEPKWKKRLEKNSHLVIYGAGNIGTDVFCGLLKEKEYHIQAWVDRKYEKIGYPVESPDLIRRIRFDHVLIAIASEGLYRSICGFLLDCGVKKEQICWIGE